MSNEYSNSFHALGFESGEAVVESLKTDMADAIRGYIERAGLSQTQLSKQLGIPQSTISAIKNDNIDRLSMEYLLKVITSAKIPWAAACQRAPHDARFVVGGISQLALARSVAQAIPAIAYWREVGEGRIVGFTVSSDSGRVDVSASTRPSAETKAAAE